MDHSISSRQNKPYSDEFWQYLRSIAKYPLLTAKEEEKLAVKAKAGDKAAFDRLVNSNLRLSVKFAKKYSFSGIDIFDLVQSGNVGLVKAARRYDPASGCRFSTYAFSWIRNEVMHYLSEMQYPFSLCPAVYGELWKIMRAAENDLGKSVDELTTDDIKTLSELTGISLKKVTGVLNNCAQFYSINAEIGEDESMQTSEVIADTNGITPEEAATQNDFIEKIQFAMQFLPPVEAEILRERFGLNDGVPKTLQELGDKMGRSKECIRLKQERGLTKLKKEVNRNEKQYYI